MSDLKALLDEYFYKYNTPAFIPDDPIGLPHRFERLQDREIVGFWTAVLAWGRRSAIIKAGERLVELFEGEPYRFVVEHGAEDLKTWERFYYRTFQTDDALYFLHFLQTHYRKHPSLEEAFVRGMLPDDPTVERGLIGFHDYFCSLPEFPRRTRKHLSSPARGAACKRLCLFLRWMVRKDGGGVDFGVWRQLSPAQLVMPLDVHVLNVARRWGLLAPEDRPSWRTALKLTERLRAFCPQDPVRYDFALFGYGVENPLMP